MKNNIKNIGFIIGLISLLFVACEDKIDPIIDELKFDRVFTPTELTATVRNMTTVELKWNVANDADYYVVEFSEDSLLFSSIVQTVNVNPDELPFNYTLEGETQYSARVKGVSESEPEESKWAAVAFKTDAENILSPVEGEDILATSVTVKWPAASEVTHFIIVPGNVERTITDQEKTDGVATITGLTGEIDYTITMHKNTKQRGVVTFTTLVDLGGATAVYPEDDLSAVIAAAQEGDALVLYPGDYTEYAGNITINKSISIKGLYPHDRPTVYIQFMLEDGAQEIEISDLDMNGTYTDTEGDETVFDYVFKYNSGDVNYGSLAITGCAIHNYNKSLITTGSNAFSAESILIDDCVVSDVYNDSGDFIDFRKSYVGNLTITNSTFSNCATVYIRDFIRMDGSSKGNSYDDGSRTPAIVVSNCTMYNVMNSESSTMRFFYIRWSQHTINSENNLFVDMGKSVYSNQSLTIQPECSMNNYFNADGYYTEAEKILIDNSSNYTTLDPGFSDATNGDFTVGNQTLLDNSIGDPRWRTGL